MTNQIKRASGFTLIELMVTLAIGAMLTATGLTLYQQTAKTQNLIQAELALQEASYFLHQTLRQFISQAGYRPLNQVAPDTAIMPVRVPSDVFEEVENKWEEGRFVRLLTNGFALRFEGASNAADAADGSLTNCAGGAIAEGVIVELEFTLSDGLFVCTTNSVEVDLVGSADDIRVEQMLVSFGVDNNNDRSVDEYKSTAGQLGASDKVVGLRLSLLLASVNEVRANPDTYTFNGTTYTATDHKIRHESVTTVQLKH